MEQFSSLFSTGYIGNIMIKNRIIMSPMLVAYASLDGEVTNALIDYYATRARGGVGLIIVEAASVDNPQGRENPRQLNIDHSRYLAGLQNLSKAIKAYGTRVFIQLFHAGRQVSQSSSGVIPVAPSAIPCPVVKEIPHELEPAEIEMIRDKFIKAAVYAQIAGFDGVEIHAAHGYLLNQFLSKASNKRDDGYGGKLENRMKLLADIISGIKAQAPRIAISVRLNIDDFVPEGLNIAESREIARLLEQLGIDVIHCSCGTYESGLKSTEPASYKEGWRIYLAEAIKSRVKIPVIAGGMISNPSFANRVIAENQADFIFLGRALLADSDWANKARNGKIDDIRPCIICNNCIESHFNAVAVDCTVNPQTGRENAIQYYIKKRPPTGPAVSVIGCGPAGMQAGLALEKRGFKVNIIEKGSSAGGMLNLACIPPHKQRIALLRDYLIRQVNKSGIRVLYNTTFATADLEDSPPYIVVATGAKLGKADINGIQSGYHIGFSDLLMGKIKPVNKNVVIIGGGRIGCEMADFLLENNNHITIIEQQKYLAINMEKKNRRDLMNRLLNRKVKRITNAKVIEIKSSRVILLNGQNRIESLYADYIVLATGLIPNNDLYREIQNRHRNVFLIGDAFAVKGLKNALLQGEMVCEQIDHLCRINGH